MDIDSLTEDEKLLIYTQVKRKKELETLKHKSWKIVSLASGVLGGDWPNGADSLEEFSEYFEYEEGDLEPDYVAKTYKQVIHLIEVANFLVSKP